MFKLILIKNAGDVSYDITPIVDSITWDSNLSMMSAMEFGIIWNDTRYFAENPCDIGDVVILYEGSKEVNRGVIVTESRSNREAIKYSVYDYAWYLGKSKSVYQFNKIPASQAIRRILNDFGMQIGAIPEMGTLIEELYIEKSPAEIIDEIYKLHEKRSGKRYNVELREGKIYFEDMEELVITGTFQLAGNVELYDVFSNPLSASRKRSIEEMKNRVKIMIERDSKDKDKPKYEVVAMNQDEKSIRKYGLLESVYKIDAEDAAKAREVARILLERLNRVQETNSLTLLGDVDFKAGRLLDVTEPITGMKGRYMIMTAKHEVTKQLHMMQIELVLPEDVK
ncbi:XkdQ/YqbQ family protein [Paenibacillus oleatilyticus]|uniref:XkdQ/YqbQ family protein n=1 Tax=Paenibacillus oleatilyticus TaxID=2594886 RepID=UPI001C2010CB|nr:hypothetical protein [Paenibacillus oleatilyticus]MBU7320271.1 hypothetical protein [Paenibacillus oleatilyticus]